MCVDACIQHYQVINQNKNRFRAEVEEGVGRTEGRVELSVTWLELEKTVFRSCTYMWRPEVEVGVLGSLLHLTFSQTQSSSIWLVSFTSLLWAFPVSALLGLNYRWMSMPTWHAMVGCGELNSGPYIYVASTLTMRPSQSPIPEYIYRDYLEKCGVVFPKGRVCSDRDDPHI